MPSSPWKGIWNVGSVMNLPDKVICEPTGWSLATLNTKFGPRKGGDDPE